MVFLDPSLKSLRQSCNHIFSKLHTKLLAKGGPKETSLQLSHLFLKFLAKNTKRFYSGYARPIIIL